MKNKNCILRAYRVFTIIGMALVTTLSGAFTAEAAALNVTKITTVRVTATIGGGFEKSWKWLFDVTIPDNETVFKIRFADLASGSNVIQAANNIRVYSAESSNATSTSPITISAANTYGDAINIMSSADIDTATEGKQIRIAVEAQVPAGSVAGSYSSSYGIDTSAPTVTILNVTSISAIPDVTVALGTPRDNLTQLPSQVQVTLSDNSTITAIISSWTEGTPAYNGNAAGIYPFIGTLVLPTNVTNTLNIRPSMNFIIPAAPTGAADDATLSSFTIQYSSSPDWPSPFTFTLTEQPAERRNFSYGLSHGTISATLSAITTSSGATVNITNPSSLPGTATIEVTSRDGSAHETYTIDISVQQP